ncbi:MAG TPA: cellulase family glycosylhydrolase [Puia sp.]|nr:cellulase family glycosylhydrolase [Puia sp.]
MKNLFAFPFLIVSFFAKAQGPPDLTNGVSGNQFTRYFMPHSDWSSQCNPQLLHAYKGMGVKSIRVPVSNETLYQDATPSVLNPANLVALDTIVIRKLLDSGFTVILDACHPLSGAKGPTSFMQMLAQDSLDARLKFRKYWIAIVSYFKRYKTEKLVFEIINEPYADDPKNHNFIYTLEDSVVKDIRAIDSIHWLAVTGIRNDKMLDGLVDSVPGIPFRDIRKRYTFPPIHAPKLIYTFHWYQPDVLIFQGLQNANLYGCTCNLPYPAFAGCADHLITAGCGNYGAIEQWKIYEAARPFQVQALPLWGLRRMDSLIKQAADYGREHHVPIWMGEGMCFARPGGIDRQSRLNYMQDAIATFRKYNIGFNLWDPTGKATLIVNNGNITAPAFDTLLLKRMGFARH